MHKGTIKRWVEGKGYGFIEPEDSDGFDGDVFVHVSKYQAAGLEAPSEGDKVLFELGTDRGRTQAIKVAPDD